MRTELRFFIRKVFTTVSPGETYLHNWHVDAIAHQLMRVRSGESRRLLINQPPRSLKSICVSVAYVAWLLGHDPTRHVIVASYSGDFAAELHRQFRMVIASEWYAAVFPNLHLAKETGLELVTSRGSRSRGPAHARRCPLRPCDSAKSHATHSTGNARRVCSHALGSSGCRGHRRGGR